MADVNVIGCVDTGTYVTSAPNPNVELAGASPNQFTIEQTFAARLSDSNTCSVVVATDRDTWVAYSGATYTTGTPNIIDLSTGTLEETGPSGAPANTDTVTIYGVLPSLTDAIDARIAALQSSGALPPDPSGLADGTLIQVSSGAYVVLT